MFVRTIRTNSTRVIAGAFAALAVAVPLYVSVISADATPDVSASPACLAWFGNKDDGNCMGYSNGAPVFVGTPEVGFGQNGFGFSVGPLLPGTTISRGIGGS
jgi:hypothetical protein